MPDSEGQTRRLATTVSGRILRPRHSVYNWRFGRLWATARKEIDLRMNWLNLFLLMLLTVGHTELWVTIINRIESLPFPKRVLRWLRMLEDLVVVAFPFVAIFAVGLGGAGLLRSGRWRDLPTGWLVYFALCARGCVGFVI